MNALKILLAVFVLGYLVSCSVSEEDGNIESVASTRGARSVLSDDEVNTAIKSDTIILGRKLPNPYSVKAMSQAQQNLLEKGLINIEDTINISTTHKYVRFLPKDSIDVSVLNSRRDLTFFDSTG